MLERLKNFLMIKLHIQNGEELFYAISILAVFVVAALVIFNILNDDVLINWLF